MFADVTSANIVGYATKNTLEKDMFYIFGSQFDSVGGSKKLVDVIGGVKGVYWDPDDLFMKTASQIQVPKKTGGYDTYYYLEDGWYDNGTEDGDTKPGWCDMGGVIVEDVELTPGVAFWFKNKTEDNSVWTQAGEVPSQDQYRVNIPIDFQLRSFPFPVAIGLNDAKFDSSEMTGVYWDSDDAFMKTAPQIQIPKATGGYDTYYYLNDGWYDNGTEDGDTKPGWSDMGGVIVDIAVPVAQGFWTKGNTAAGWMTFKK